MPFGTAEGDASFALTVRPSVSLRGEALAAVEADGGAVQHRVLEDRLRHARVLLGPPHALREGRVLRERVLHRLRDAAREARVEEARRDRHHADAEAAEV